MGKKRYTLETLQEIQLDLKEEITVEANDTGELKTIKTVSRAEVATIVAYMLGIEDARLEEYYSHHYGALLEKLRRDRGATTIRYLCRIRTTILNNFLNIDNDIRYNLSNLDRMPCFNKKEIDKLFSWGIAVVQPNYRSDRYIQHITELIDNHIDACKGWFPDSVKFEYIRSLFVIPKYNKPAVMIEEYNKFRGNKNLYPFQAYMYWEPVDCGYILYSDAKFLSVIYGQHGEIFTEGYKYRDASDDTKQNIYRFIHESQQVVMAVDCENADPYKLYAVLKNLDPQDIGLIHKIILYDDYHTTIAWDYIQTLIDIPVEHIEVPRVTDAKSLVDIQMTVGVSAAHYRDGIDSFILCSSDSDFWGLISSIPEARFLVMYEYSKCGNAIKEALNSRSIFHCAMDDFYMENAGELQQIVLKKVLENYLPKVVGENGWELTRRIYSDAYISATEKEMRRFYEKYIKTLRLKMDLNGNFYVALGE
jgi:hypothetical protein